MLFKVIEGSQAEDQERAVQSEWGHGTVVE